MAAARNASIVMLSVTAKLGSSVGKPVTSASTMRTGPGRM